MSTPPATSPTAGLAAASGPANAATSPAQASAGPASAPGRPSPTAPLLRPLNPAEQQALTAARLRALQDCPYFAHALFSVIPVAAEGLGTFAVDASWRLYLDPATLTGWGPELAAGVLNHEVGHLLRDHAGRAAGLGPHRNHTLWNYATDAAINDDLLAAGITLPEGAVTPTALDLPAEGIEENYYQELTDQLGQDYAEPDDAQNGTTGEDSNSGQGSSGLGCGSGAGDEPAPWELPTTRTSSDASTDHDDNGSDGTPALSTVRAQLVRRAVAHAVREHVQNHHRSNGRGTVPAGLRRWAENTLAEPTIDWRRALGPTIRRAVHYRAGSTSPTYTRPPRYRIPGIITPGARRPQVTVAAVVDTSASVSQELLHAALGEVVGIVKATGVPDRGMNVLAVDAEVAAVTRVRRASSVLAEVNLSGGGGTDMRVGIEDAEKLRPDAIVVLTDGYTPWPATATRARLIVCVLGAAQGDSVLAAVPRWASAVAIPAPG